MKKKFKKQKGQAIVEYVIIVVVVALAALVVLGAFSDRIRSMIAGVTTELGGAEEEPESSVETMKNLGSGGFDSNEDGG
jgi:Flp pilus assembly pilin Flp